MRVTFAAPYWSAASGSFASFFQNRLRTVDQRDSFPAAAGPGGRVAGRTALAAVAVAVGHGHRPHGGPVVVCAVRFGPLLGAHRADRHPCRALGCRRRSCGPWSRRPRCRPGMPPTPAPGSRPQRSQPRRPWTSSMSRRPRSRGRPSTTCRVWNRLGHRRICVWEARRTRARATC